jgi:phosphatidylglycerophosphatase A
VPKLIFKDEESMLRAFLGCKFCHIECETEYEEDKKCYVDELSFEMEGVK